MKKNQYVKPAVEQYEMETEQMLLNKSLPVYDDPAKGDGGALTGPNDFGDIWDSQDMN